MRLDHFQSKAEAIAYVRENVYNCDNYRSAEAYLREHVPRESHYQKKIMEFLKKTYPRAVIWKAAAGPYTKTGIPDVCAVINGRFFGFEIKRPYFGEPSKRQLQMIDEFRVAGGVAEIVTFPEEVQAIIDEHL